MHEFGIAESILGAALDAARANGAIRVESVRLRLGALSGVVADALQFAFASLSEDTAAQGAHLVVEVVPVTCYCAACATEFVAEGFAYVCPGCAALSSEVRRGRELELVSIEVS